MAHPLLMGGGGKPGAFVKRSVRGRANVYFERTLTTNSEGTVYHAFSAWVRRGPYMATGPNDPIFFMGTPNTAAETPVFSIAWKNPQSYAADTHGLIVNATFGTTNYRAETPDIRDSEWHHLFVVLQTNVADPEGHWRIAIALDNVWQNHIVDVQPPFNFNMQFTAGMVQQVLCRPLTAGSNPWPNWSEGTIAEVHYLDSVGASPTDFGQLVEGVWVPKRFNARHGAQGFYLDFGSAGGPVTTDLANGFVFSSNMAQGRNDVWTDLLTDAPVRQYPVLDAGNNAVISASNQFSISGWEGGLTTWNPTAAGNYTRTAVRDGLPVGKWYFEYTLTASAAAGYAAVGFVKAGAPMEGGLGYDSFSWALFENGFWYHNGGNVNLGAPYVVGDKIGVYVDVVSTDVAYVRYAKNGAWLYQGDTSSLSGGPFRVASSAYPSGNSAKLNFGQQGWWHAPLDTAYKAFTTDQYGAYTP